MKGELSLIAAYSAKGPNLITISLAYHCCVNQTLSGLSFCISEEKLMRERQLPMQEMAVSSSASLLFSPSFPTLL